MLPNNSKVLLYNQPVDMRKSIDGLAIIVAGDLGLNPSDGGLYIFYNKKYNKLKMLFWHRNGFSLLYKRLEKEKFKIPKLAAAQVISYEQLCWLFEGLDINKVQGFKVLKYKVFF